MKNEREMNLCDAFPQMTHAVVALNSKIKDNWPAACFLGLKFKAKVIDLVFRYEVSHANAGSEGQFLTQNAQLTNGESLVGPFMD